MLPIICITINNLGTIVMSNVFRKAEMTSNNPKAIVAPYVYSIAFFVPKLFTVDKMTMFVGPGVNVTIKQYSNKDVVFMRRLLSSILI